MTIDPTALSLGVALGIGLLIGAERERRKGEGPARGAAGVRTFTLASLAGAVSLIISGSVGFSVVLAGLALLAAAGYRRSGGEDPGLTTEVALLLTALLGGLSVGHPAYAAGAAVVVAVLLATRTPLHRFVKAGFSDAEARDALILAGAALVVLPLLPDRRMGPFSAFDPYAIWRVVVLVLAIGAAGHVAVRLVGDRFGLAITGLASGFVSSIATIGALGAQARKTPALMTSAAAGAILSSVATIVQLAVVIGATSLATLRVLGPSLIAAGVIAAAYGAIFTASLLRREEGTAPPPAPARAFSLAGALAFAGTVALVLLIAAAFRVWFGDAGVLAAAAVAGFADTHAAAISVAALVSEGRMSPAEAAIPILAGFLSNSISKVVFAATSGGRSFVARVGPGLVLVAAAAWAARLVVH